MTAASKLEPLVGFEVAVRYVGEGVVVTVYGEVDFETVPHLSGVVNAVIDRGPSTVVLDLGGASFVGAGGLGIIATGAGRLVPDGGQMVVRRPSRLLRRMMQITGLSKVVSIESTDESVRHLGGEQPSPGIEAPVVASIESAVLSYQLQKMMAFPADTDVLDGALRLVVALAQLVVQRADGVSISLNRHGRLMTVAATDQTVSSMDAGQYESGQGPCIDAAANGRWFYAESISDESRWPDFTPKALDLGINAILSTPLLLTRDRPVGAINMYSRTAEAFADRDQEIASTFATEASLILSDAGVEASEDDVTSRLAESLRVREVIAQAQGVLMDREAVSSDGAYAMLRRSALTEGRTFAELAAEVVASTRPQMQGE